MKVLQLAALIVLLFAKTEFAFAQDNFLPCHTDEMIKKSLAAHPEKNAEQQQLETFTQQYSLQPIEKQIYVIPVVFHIIHQYGTENISDAQILDEMNILNQDFSLTNADAANIISSFTGIAANCGIEFRLANKDPQGNCTNGIDRIVSAETNIGDEGSKLNPWPRNMYLNVWVTKVVDGAAAYAYRPGTAPSSSVDGIIMRADYCGSIGISNHTKSHTLTHEIGHFFNLYHTWGSGNSPGVSCGNDQVGDTPQTEGWTSCNLAGATCGSPVDNVQNYMDYSYCSCMFTAGQKTRMLAALNSAWGSRNNLWTSSNLSATGVSGTVVICTPIADFKVSNTFICAGSNVNFTDLSFNGHVTNRTWTVSGGTSTSLTDSVITVTYNNPGIYNVTLTVSNASGSDAVTKNSVITVLSGTAMYENGYTEDFENDVMPDDDWVAFTTGTGIFNINTYAHYTGVKSLMFMNSANFVGVVSQAIGPTIDMTAISNPVLTFHLAFAQRTSADADKLRLLVSTDCGKTWVQRYYRLGVQLATVASPITSSFNPTSESNWRMETVSLSNYATVSNLRIQFEFTSQGGNNIFIDDINIGGYSFADAPLSSDVIQIFPNPVNDEINIQSSTGIVPESISLVDAAGRLLLQFTPSLSTSQLNIQNYSSGIYFLKVKMNDGSILVRKIVKE